jgi:hypothetical protein
MYSGPVAAYGYRAIAHRPYDFVVLVGPSHYVAFDGVAASGHSEFRSPLGGLPIDTVTVDALVNSDSSIFEDVRIHAREHSLELQREYDAIGRVTLGQALAYAKTSVGPQTAGMLLVGDRAKIESAIRDLKLGEIVILDTQGRPTGATAPAPTASANR